MLSPWILSFQAATQNHLIHASLMSAALSWCPGCQQGFQEGSGLLAGLACCVGSPDVIALLLPVPWNFWHGMEDRGLPTLQVLHRSDIAFWCRSMWDVSSIVQIIKIANWRGGGKGYHKSQLLFSFPLLVVLSRLELPLQWRGCISSRQYLMSSTFSCREGWLFHKQHEMS